VFVAALIVLLIVVLLVIAVLFGADVTSTVGSTHGVITIDLGSLGSIEMDPTALFFLGMATLLLFFLSLGMFRSAAKRAAARRADRKKVSELSTKLDEYKRDERDESRDINRDDT
jgi:hypothetical protein